MHRGCSDPQTHFCLSSFCLQFLSIKPSRTGAVAIILILIYCVYSTFLNSLQLFLIHCNSISSVFVSEHNLTTDTFVSHWSRSYSSRKGESTVLLTSPGRWFASHPRRFFSSDQWMRGETSPSWISARPLWTFYRSLKSCSYSPGSAFWLRIPPPPLFFFN